jgi:hypothetical protein
MEDFQRSYIVMNQHLAQTIRELSDDTILGEYQTRCGHGGGRQRPYTPARNRIPAVQQTV